MDGLGWRAQLIECNGQTTPNFLFEKHSHNVCCWNYLDWCKPRILIVNRVWVLIIVLMEIDRWSCSVNVQRILGGFQRVFTCEARWTVTCQTRGSVEICRLGSFRLVNPIYNSTEDEDNDVFNQNFPIEG